MLLDAEGRSFTLLPLLLNLKMVFCKALHTDTF